MVDKFFIDNLPELIEANPDVQAYLVPRINTVEGLTEEHVKKWGWNVNDKGWINFPDFQRRLYKNIPQIKWINRVHETLVGFQTWAPLPLVDNWCIKHPKDIKRQEEQNNYYDTL